LGIAQQVKLEPTDPASSAAAVYHWSGAAKMAGFLCNNLPPLQEGQVYQVWFFTGSDSYPVGKFQSWHGIGQLTRALEDLPGRPVAVGLSIEDAEDVEEPREVVLIAQLQE
jgi:hypothetical protein